MLATNNTVHKAALLVYIYHSKMLCTVRHITYFQLNIIYGNSHLLHMTLSPLIIWLQ